MKKNKNSIHALLKDRAVIPKWKPPQQAVETYSIDKEVMNKRMQSGSQWIRHLESTYEQAPTTITSNELYETALMYGNFNLQSPIVKKLPQKVLGAPNKLSTSPLQYGAAPTTPPLILGESVDVHDKVARQEISRLRKLLGSNPARPFCWTELSRNYLVLGEKDKAIRSMNAALQLAKHNRYLCRVATRLFVHVNDVDQALHLLRREPSIKNDPWLLAAEIASSSISNKQSKLIDSAKKLITSDKYNKNQLSELASAVGSVELMHGTIKRAKELFQTSLIAPTDNSLAQAQWAVEQDSKIVIPATAWQTTTSYEARTLASRMAHDWRNALHTCASWLADEPFSERAALIGSYLGFRPEHAAIAEQFATAGLRCASDNISLLNNRAVARVYQGKLEDAYKDVQEALLHKKARDNAYLMATIGLIAFRNGMHEFGRKCYGKSIGWFSDQKDSAAVASAILYLLREEILIDKTVIPQAVEMAKRISKLPILLKHPEIAGMTQLVFEEARAGTNNNLTPNRNSIASEVEFNYCASLFHLPTKAIQIGTRFENYTDLI